MKPVQMPKANRKTFIKYEEKYLWREFRALLNYAVKWNTYREILLLLSGISEIHMKIKRKWIFYTPKEFKSTYKPPKSKQNYPNNQQEVYMNGISMYFLISHFIRVCVKG